jgi:biopolymer transport protein ExbB/TolQ
METVVVVAIALVLIGFVATLLIASRVRARNDARRIRREKLASVVDGHREMASAHAGSVADLAPQAEGHREAAIEHARIADELLERIEREHRHAQFHEECALETQDERDRI